MTDGVVIPQHDREVIGIPVETICEDTSPSFDLFIRARDGRFVLFVRGGSGVDRSSLERVAKSGRRILHVRHKDAGAYHSYVADHLEEVLSDPSVPKDRKAAIVYESASHLMNSVLKDPLDGDNLKRTAMVAKHTASLVAEADSIETILAMTNFDYTTHTHSVNVCVYGLSFAKHLGMSNTETLHELGTGLLLHDVGKAKVDQAILNKPGKLTPEEFEHMKSHPELGGMLLSSRDDLPETAFIIATQHHERFDGAGYPAGISGEGIHDYARLSAVLDVFDALTTRRPYKDAMDSFDALRIMKGDSGHFDEELVNALIRMLAQRG